MVFADIKETNISPPAPHATPASTATREVKKEIPDMPKTEESNPAVAHDKYDVIPPIDVHDAQSIPSENEYSSKLDEESDLGQMEVEDEKEEKEHMNMELDTPVAEEEASENQKEDNVKIAEEDETVPESTDIILPETSIDAVPDASVNESTSIMKPPMQQQQLDKEKDKGIEASVVEEIDEPVAAATVEKESSTTLPWQKVTKNDITYYNSLTGTTQWEIPKELILFPLIKDKEYDDELIDMTNIQEEHLTKRLQSVPKGDLTVPLTNDAAIPQEQQQLKSFVETKSSVAETKDVIEEEKMVEDAPSPPTAVAAIVENEDGIVQNLAESSPAHDDDVRDEQKYVDMDVEEVISEGALKVNEPIPAVAKDVSLSCPWEEMMDCGRTFYYNNETGDTQWEKPNELMTSPYIQEEDLLQKDKVDSNIEKPTIDQVCPLLLNISYLITACIGVVQFTHVISYLVQEESTPKPPASPPISVMRGAGDEPEFTLPLEEEMIAVEAEDKSAAVVKHSANDGVGGRTVVDIVVNVEDVVQQAFPTAVDVGPEPVAEDTSKSASSPWQEVLDPVSDTVYYYNHFTRVTQWEKPEELHLSLLNQELAHVKRDDINDGIDIGAADGSLLQPVEGHINIVQEHKDKIEEEVLEPEDAPVMDDSMNGEIQQDVIKNIVPIKGTTKTVDESSVQINNFSLITEQTQCDIPMMEINNSTTAGAAFSVLALDTPMAVDSSDVSPVVEQPSLDVPSHSAVEVNTVVEDTTFVSEFPLVDDVPPPPQQQQVEDQGEEKEMNATIESDEDLMLLSRILSDDDNDERDDPVGNIAEEESLSLSPWQEVTDPDSGSTYYYNFETRATQLEKPEEFITSTTKSAEVIADDDGIEGTNHVMQQVSFVNVDFWLYHL